MKVALDPFMHRRLPIAEVVTLAAELGYEYLEWSWRDDFIPLFLRPRADAGKIGELKESLRSTGIQLASLVALYRWASTDVEQRAAAVRYWRRAIEIAVELECPTMNSEFGGLPEAAEASEAAWWRSIEELIPVLEREGISLDLEPHPGDFVEDGNAAVDIIKSVGSPRLRYLYCAPHTFHMGEDMVSMITHAAPILAHVHVADTLNHRASSGLRYIVNPLGSPVRVHQHLDIGDGEIDWEAFFSALHRIGFDGIMSSCVFSCEERAIESSRFMRSQIEAFIRAASGPPAAPLPSPSLGNRR